MCVLSVLLTWPARRWLVAVLAGVGTFAMLGLATAVVANPVFGRSIAPTPWAMEVLVATSILTGLLTATYVRRDGGGLAPQGADDRPARGGLIGGALAYVAIGCPVCNKLVLLALGASGAVRVFAPIQPYLAMAGMLLLGWALYVRLGGEASCAWAPPPAPEESATAVEATQRTPDQSSVN